MEIVIFWIICGVIAALIASSRGGSGGLGFLVGGLLGPLGIIISFFMGSPQQKEKQQIDAGESKKCPKCAEIVRSEAVVCRYCGHNFA